MARVLVTGSTDGLGRAAACALMQDGHHVVLHARSQTRAAAVADLASRSLGIVVGDLGSAAETRSVADHRRDPGILAFANGIHETCS